MFPYYYYGIEEEKKNYYPWYNHNEVFQEMWQEIVQLDHQYQERLNEAKQRVLIHEQESEIMLREISQAKEDLQMLLEDASDFKEQAQDLHSRYWDLRGGGFVFFRETRIKRIEDEMCALESRILEVKEELNEYEKINKKMDLVYSFYSPHKNEWISIKQKVSNLLREARYLIDNCR